MNINQIAMESNNKRKKRFVLSAGLKVADSGVVCFPSFLLRQQRKKMQDGEWAGRARASNSSPEESQGRGIHGDPGLEGGCGYGRAENLGHRICFIGQVQGHHCKGLPGCRVPTLFSVTQDSSYNVPMGRGCPHTCESIKAQ